jgi:hypothetical protein
MSVSTGRVSQIFSPGQAEIVCTPSTTLAELALANQMAFSWFVGHGAYRFFVRRQWQKSPTGPGTLHTFWNTDVTFRPLIFTLFATFNELHREGYIPQKFLPDDLWKPPQQAAEYKVVLGNQRITSHGDYTLIQGRNIPLSQRLFQEAYGISDLLTTVFVSGATEVAYQASLNMVQVNINRVFSESVIRSWFDLNKMEPTYEPNEPVTRINNDGPGASVSRN